MRKIVLSAVCASILASSMAYALSFGPAPQIEIPDRNLVQFLPSRNEALEKALTVHNLMTELPALQAMTEQQEKMKSHLEDMQKFFDNLMKCNEQRLGRFKNPGEVLGKLRTAYKERTQNLGDELEHDENSIVPRSLALRSQITEQKREIEEALLVDVFKNGTKWGAKPIDKRNTNVPENLKMQLVGTGLEELSLAEDGTMNAKMADIDFDNTFLKMQKDFIKKLNSVGLQFPNFDATRIGDIYEVKKALQELKAQYLTEAKGYIEKLDQQDAAYPEAVARRTARTQNKKQVLKKAQEAFPDVFTHQQFDQQTPQQKQRVLIMALEKDKDGTVFLTETNATEVDQKMAESEANKAMLQSIQTQLQSYMDNMTSSMPRNQEFNFDQCST